MQRSTPLIVEDIASFVPVGDDWRPLQALLDELWSDAEPQSVISELLGLFERYPTEDGAGVFWSVLHGLESLTGYEPLLLESVLRAPSEMGVTMVGRLANAGVRQVDGKSLTEVLQITARQSATPAVRSKAGAFLRRIESLT